MTTAPAINFATREMMRVRGLNEYGLRIEAISDVSPHMRRVTFSGDARLVSMAPQPGQDLLLMLPNSQSELERRHYTIRSFDAQAHTLNIDFVLHGAESLAMRWLGGARQGDEIIAFGPRGRNILHDGAAWRLFVADETGLPAVAGMIEAMPEGAFAQAYVEIAEANDQQHIRTKANADVVWLPRGGPPQPPSKALIDTLRSWQAPEGDGHIYLLAETSAVRTIRHELLARGFSKSSIFAEGYWRPGRFGGHDHV